ncbi:MAG: DUF4230 domain-containing protein [Sphingobacteriales bacterium]|jgi:hypothetical protein|nr:MAG: DUF4230 domain-containing protein [Sphingobacteriales bacterium]
MINFRFLIKVISFFVVAVLLFYGLYRFKNDFFGSREILNQDIILTKITTMGKLELVKFSMKDVIDKTEVKDFWPDERILFVAVGEVTACIDLTKVKKEDIRITNDSLTLFLPQPEICYTKLDHQKSKIYDVSGMWFSDTVKDRVEDMYKIAENKIFTTAMQMNILGKAKENALLIFKPLVVNLSGKKVGFVFK